MGRAFYVEKRGYIGSYVINYKKAGSKSLAVSNNILDVISFFREFKKLRKNCKRKIEIYLTNLPEEDEVRLKKGLEGLEKIIFRK